MQNQKTEYTAGYTHNSEKFFDEKLAKSSVVEKPDHEQKTDNIRKIGEFVKRVRDQHIAAHTNHANNSQQSGFDKN